MHWNISIEPECFLILLELLHTLSSNQIIGMSYVRSTGMKFLYYLWVGKVRGDSRGCERYPTIRKTTRNTRVATEPNKNRPK